MPGHLEPRSPAAGAAADGQAVDELMLSGRWLSALRGVPFRFGVAVKGL